jgi:simple sugar transport system permease protein
MSTAQDLEVVEKARSSGGGRNIIAEIIMRLLPLLLALAVTTAILLLIDADPRKAFEVVWQGAFGRPTDSAINSKSASTLMFWVPLALSSTGLLLTFTTDLWNIGVEGQMMMGAVFASGVALKVHAPDPLQVPLQIAAAALGGALWGALCAVLKTRGGVHEIFGGVALNNIAAQIALYLIGGPWQPEGGGSFHSTDIFRDAAQLPRLTLNEQALPINPAMLIIMIIAFGAVLITLRGTTWGLQLKATGKSARSAFLLGVPTERNTILALAACGALAGIGGSVRAMLVYNSLRPGISGGIGYLALLVVLLAGIKALWVPVISFLFAAIMSGSGTALQTRMQLDSSLGGILQGFMVMFFLLTNGVRQKLTERSQEEAGT